MEVSDGYDDEVLTVQSVNDNLRKSGQKAAANLGLDFR
jgi:hypothetical protein